MTSTPGTPSSDPTHVNRRDFLRRAAVLGVSASAVGAFLAACGGTPTATTAPAAAPSAAGSAAPSVAAASLGARLPAGRCQPDR
jgi:hypothetical protein